MLNRENLVKAIFDSDETWSCPNYNCTFDKEKCMKCADEQLREYEEELISSGIEQTEFDRKFDEAVDLIAQEIEKLGED